MVHVLGSGGAGWWGRLVVVLGLVCGMTAAARGQAVAAMSMRAVKPGDAPGYSAGTSSATRDEREPVVLSEEEEFPRPQPPGGEVVAQKELERGDPASFWTGWTGTVQAGVNGSSGNSENFNLRMGFAATRKTEPMETALDASYTWATDGGEKTKSRGDLNLRNDWTLGESRWFVFGVGKVEYDEFQDWRWRVSAIAGPGYALVRDDVTTIKLRTGIGASREFGGGRNEIVPELDLGADAKHQLTERQSIFITHDTYPSVEDLADLRMVTKAGWEILVDPEVNLLFTLGVEHRHQSQPGEGFRKNDLDYYAVLGWSF